MENEIIQTVKKCLYSILEETERANVDYDTDIIDLLDYDSLNIMSLILEIETDFGFEFDEEELDFSVWSNFDNVIKLISSKINGESR